MEEKEQKKYLKENPDVLAEIEAKVRAKVRGDEAGEAPVAGTEDQAV